MEEPVKIEEPDNVNESAPASSADEQPTSEAAVRRHPLSAWTAAVLAVSAWLILMFSTGYVALAAGALAVVASIWGIAANHGGLRRLSIASLVAAAVLVIVVGAFVVAVRML